MIKPYLLSKKDLAYDNVGFEIYDNKTLAKLDNVDETSQKPDDTTDEPGENTEPNNPQPKPNNPTVNPATDYIGTIEIPKINLKKGFVSPSSKYNDIEYNVTIIDGFDYPNVDKGNFILAAHSGSGPKALFKDLYKLSVGDMVKISYKGKLYTYKVKNIYTQKKQGYLTIFRNPEKTTLSLITCTKNNKTLQTVYIAELI